MKIIDKLNGEFFIQPFEQEDLRVEELNTYKQLAQQYARQENSIAVLSDLHNNVSYIYYGGVAETLGLGKKGDSLSVPSIWEEDIFKYIHPEDMSNKYLQELRFYHYMKQLPKQERNNHFLMSKLRMKDSSGNYQTILHRMFYVVSPSNDLIWLALCLYNLSIDTNLNCIVVNSLTGKCLELEKQDYSHVLSEREKEILSLIGIGKPSKEIADLLFISKNTVSRHRQNILSKLQVRNSIEAYRIAKELGLL